MNKVALFSLLVVLLASADASFWRACTHLPNLPGPISVTSPNCGATSCTVTRGQMMFADVVIESPAVHTELMVEGIVFILGIGVPLPQVPPYDNGCNSLFTMDNVRTSCPTVPNTRYIWRVEQEVPTITPAFNNALVRFSINDRGTVVGCVELFATVV